MTINYVKGDATEPAGDGPKVIPHICNDARAWGAGFVLALSAKWPTPEQSYRRWGRAGGAVLGWVQPVAVEPNLWVINMIAQSGVGPSSDGTPPIRYDALRTCLGKAGRIAISKKASIHMPKIGAGLARGDWRVIEQLIKEELVEKGLTVTVYEFDG